MSLSRTIRTGIAAVTVLAISAGSALAFPASSTTHLNVRTGPGTGYKVVDALYAGEQVDVKQCQSGWCYIDHSGPDGWVSAKYLSQGGGYTPPPQHQPPQHNNNPSVNFGFSFGNGNSSFNYSFGNGGYHHRPTPKVCFYGKRNFRGASFCVKEGQALPRLGNWNNRITSVKTFGGATATLCRGKHFNQFCRTVYNNEAKLGPFLNNQVSSLRVH